MKRTTPMKRSTKPMRKSHGKVANAAEREYMGRVAALGCIVCSECLGYQDTPAIVHHIRTGQGKMRASHFDTMPLCPIHHQDSGCGVHDMGRQQFAEMYGRSELELLAIVKNKLGVSQND
jgi:hypothetical protein